MKVYLTKKQAHILYLVGILTLTLIIPLLMIGLKNYRGSLKEVENPQVSILGTNLEKVKEVEKEASGSPEEAARKIFSSVNKEYQNKLTLIFFYDGYSDQQEALRHINVLKATLNLLEPFSTSNNVATKIFTTPEQKCFLKPKGNLNILECDPKLVESFNALGIERFKVIVLSPLQFNSHAKLARGKNSAVFISTFSYKLTRESHNKWLGLTFSHELGHAFGLIDEYSASQPEIAKVIIEEDGDPLSSSSYKAQKPNCAPDQATAKAWWGDYITEESSPSGSLGIYPGCGGKDSFFYPTRGSLMSYSPNKESYGLVSEEYLRAVIDCFYANQDQVTYPAGKAGKINDCSKFRAEYSNFWEE